MRRVVLVLLALVMFVPSVARASAWYRCAHDGETRSSCCCPPAAKHHNKTPASNTALRAACCCSITQLAAQESSERAVSPLALDMAPVMVTVAIAVAPIETSVRLAILDGSRPQRGPPESLFARFCSLLL